MVTEYSLRRSGDSNSNQSKSICDRNRSDILDPYLETAGTDTGKLFPTLPEISRFELFREQALGRKKERTYASKSKLKIEGTN